jgi:hypothetical protein
MRESFVAYATRHSRHSRRLVQTRRSIAAQTWLAGRPQGKRNAPGAERSLGGVGRIAGRLIISEEVEDGAKFV